MIKECLSANKPFFMWDGRKNVYGEQESLRSTEVKVLEYLEGTRSVLDKAEFILERKCFFIYCRMRISLFRMRILVCEVEK